MGSAEGEGARKRGRERGGAVNEGDGGRPSRRRNLPVPEKCHSLFGYDQFSGTGKFRLWLGRPRLLRSPPPLVRTPVCVRPPHLRPPSFPHRQGVPKVSWPHHFRDPHMLTPPFAQVTPLAWPPPFVTITPYLSRDTTYCYCNATAGVIVRR